jgi:predicted metal-dependent hydrolase
MAAIHIRNIIKNCEYINDSAREIVDKAESSGQINFDSKQILQLLLAIRNLRTSIEQITNGKGGTPADLPNPSFQAFQWINYLSSKKRLLEHLHGLFEFVKISRSKQANKKAHTNHIQISLRNSGYLFRSHKKTDGILIEINEGFTSAPLEIKDAIIRASLGDKGRDTGRMIRRYAKSPRYQEVLHELKKVDAINKLTAKGEVYDLAVIFQLNNQKYFQESLQQPRLIWSTRRSKRRLGMFDPESGTITINRILDSEGVPQIALEYILFHEMLHQKMGIIESNGRRYAHTPVFKSAEKQFIDLASADAYIKKLLQNRN